MHVGTRKMTLALAAAALAAVGCDESLRDLTGPTPDLEVSFASIQQQIFQTTDASGRTACTNCHTNAGRGPAAELNLLPEFAHAALVNAPSRQNPGAVLVVPGDPDNSYLVRKLEGAASIAGARMPRNGPPYLTSGQLLVIRRWIENGARAD
ncbi:MAG TPA: hypothetical protein VK886_18665 [Vicinamibacterales bacterium]|nr:hypothetical protein [Vicinamibacterales bacterium]